MKIVFMGTPEFAVYSLDVLKERGDEVLLVVTQEDKPKGRGKKLQFPPVKEKAIEYGYTVYQPDKIKKSEHVEHIKALKPDLIVVTAFGQILSKEILEIPKYGCINVHASLLPKLRGAAPINYAIINGDKTTGITTMYMAEGLDTGDMILKDEVEILKEDTASTLHDKLAKLSQTTLKKTLEAIEKGVAPRIEQIDEESTYAPMMKKDLGHVDFSWEAEKVIDLIRGVDPWPSAYGYLKGETVKLSKVRLGKLYEGKEFGKILSVEDYIEIACKDKSILVYEVQFPNKKKMLVSEYLKGNKIEPDDIFS